MRLLRFLRKNQPSRHPFADRTFRYGTHVPVLQSILEVFRPRGILELGVGRNSTPLFYEYGKKLISIETNRDWFEEISREFPERTGFTLIHHELRNIVERTKLAAIPQHVQEQCVQYYRSIKAANPDLDLLFIDHVSGLRACTLVSMYRDFDFVVYHDADKAAYGYELLADHDSGSHLRFVLRSFVPHTGCLIRKSLAQRLPEFERSLDRHSKEYFARPYRFDLQVQARAG